MTVAPIFIFSLPRSGSTLLQSLVASHSDVGTASEPWLLLPLMYGRRARGVHAEYRHRLAAVAVDEFARQLPGGRNSYNEALRDLILRLYTEAAGDTKRYFVDKTPRYHLIVNEIIDLFPEGKFIFLWRNPLSVLSSIIETWGHGNWNLHHYFIDLRLGLGALAAAAEVHSGRVIEVRYEDLVSQPQVVMGRIGKYLDLVYDESILNRYRSVPLLGAMGDKTGVSQYESVSERSVSKWDAAVSNFPRRQWTRAYLRALDPGLLERLGYDLEGLLEEIRARRWGWASSFGDALKMAYGEVHWRVDRLILDHQVTAVFKRRLRP